MLLHPRVMKPLFETILGITPILLSIFLIGYIFGNPVQKDLMIIVSIIIMIGYTIILVSTSSSYNYLIQTGSICPQKIRNSVVLFLYGIIRFLPTVFHEYSNTIRMYRYISGRKIKFYDVLEIFPPIVNKSLSKVHRYSASSEALLQSGYSISFSIIDLIIPVIILGQIGLIFL